MRRITDEIDDDAGNKHLYHALASFDGVRRLLANGAILCCDDLLPVKLFTSGEELPSGDGVAGDLDDHWNEIEEHELDVLVGDEQLPVVTRETQHAEGHACNQRYEND